MHVSISAANAKMGVTPSVSLPPILTCRSEAPCATSGCYAERLCRLRPSVRKAWQRNLRIYREDPAYYFGDIRRYIEYERVLRFRFHVGGDVPDEPYLAGMITLAQDSPNTKFLCFSKNYELLGTVRRPPANLTFIASAWPGLELPEFISRRYPVAWLDDGTDERIPADAHRCIGCCSHCYSCWSFKAGTHIQFKKH